MATKAQEYDFAPSRELSIVGGILAGLKARHDKMKASEAEQAKAQQSFMRIYMPLLMRQKQFEQTELRERREFEQTAEARVTEATTQRTFEKAREEFKADIQQAVLQYKSGDARALLGLEQRFDERMAELTRQARGTEAAEERRHKERMQDVLLAYKGGAAEKQREFLAGESELTRTLTEEMARLSREQKDKLAQDEAALRRELKPIQYTADEQPQVDAYLRATIRFEELTAIFNNPENEVEDNIAFQETYAAAVEELVKQGDAVAPIFRRHNQAPPSIPDFRIIPKVERPFFGRFGIPQKDIPMQKVPRGTVPVLTPSQRAPEAPVPAEIDQGKPTATISSGARFDQLVAHLKSQGGTRFSDAIREQLEAEEINWSAVESMVQPTRKTTAEKKSSPQALDKSKLPSGLTGPVPKIVQRITEIIGPQQGTLGPNRPEKTRQVSEAVPRGGMPVPIVIRVANDLKDFGVPIIPDQIRLEMLEEGYTEKQIRWIEKQIRQRF